MADLMVGPAAASVADVTGVSGEKTFARLRHWAYRNYLPGGKGCARRFTAEDITAAVVLTWLSEAGVTRAPFHAAAPIIRDVIADRFADALRGPLWLQLTPGEPPAIHAAPPPARGKICVAIDLSDAARAAVTAQIAR